MPWYLGRPGALVPLPAPSRGTQVPFGGGGATHQLLSGGQVVDKSPAKRSWQFTWQALTQDQVGVLDGFVYGTVGRGPYVLVDPEQRNLLAPNVAASGSVTGDTTGFTAGPNGVTLSAIVSQLGNPPTRMLATEPTSVVAFQHALITTAYVPVIAGLTYTLSMWYSSTALSHYAEIDWFDSAKSYLGNATGSGSTATGVLTGTAAAPSNAAYALCALNTATTSGSSQGASVEQVQFEQASSRSAWVPGQGVPYVSVMPGGGRSRQQTNQNDYSLTLVEV